MPDEHDMSNPPNPPDPTLLETDLPCVSCDYNLRGLPPDGRCPECATPVAVSLQGNWLRFANRRWLRKNRIGVACLIWVKLYLCGYVAIYFLVLWRTGGSLSARHTLALDVLMFVLHPLGHAIGVAGTFLVTSAEPRLAYRPGSQGLGKAARIAAVIAFVTTHLPDAAWRITGVVSLAWHACGMAAGLVCVVQYLGELVYLRRLARRIPRPSLSRWTTPVLWGLPALAGAALVARLLVTLLLYWPMQSGSATAPSPAGLAAVQASTVTTAVGAAFMLWYLVLLFIYRRALARVAKEASDIA